MLRRRSARTCVAGRTLRCRNGMCNLSVLYSRSRLLRRFNPDSGPYGFGPWPGGLPKHAFYPNKTEPYTGALPIKDYLKDIQLAQMRILAQKYETDIMVSFM